jgi:hypothetical protein
MVLLLVPAIVRAEDDIELRNWTAPPYWVPEQGPDRLAAARASVGEQTSDPQPLVNLPSGPLPFIAITPCRLADTRDGTFPFGYGPPFMVAAGPRNFVFTGRCGIPASAQAVSANLTATNTLGPGFILNYPAGGSLPSPPVSSLNYVLGQTVANSAIVPLGTGGAATFIAGVSGTDLIIDVNGYYAGTGLVTSLNALTGDVVLSPGSNVTITPSSGNMLTIASANSGGTVTTIGTGPGLMGGPITSAGIISVATGGITSSMLATGAVGLLQIDSSQVQARVTSICPPGSTIQSIGADGSVVCAGNPVPQSGFSLTPVDTAGNVCQFPSITIGSDGLGLLSYYDITNHDLKVAHCLNVACTSATFSTRDSGGDVGQYTSIAIGSDGLGLISYYDVTNGDLKVAHCSDVACTGVTLSTLDSAGDVGLQTSITIGSDGLGLISYYDISNGDLKVAHCTNVSCTAATLSTLDSAGTVGALSSITVGSDGLGLISYFDSNNTALRVAHCSDVACTSADLYTLDSAGIVGQYTSITVGSDGLGLISYRDLTNLDLKVAHCSNVACSAASLATLDSAGDVGQYDSITIGSDGLGLISYSDITNSDLKVAHCSNVACSTATLSTLDSPGFVGFYTSITIGSDGFGLIAYRDNSNGDLKVAHCSNAFCTPYVRRR